MIEDELPELPALQPFNPFHRAYPPGNVSRKSGHYQTDSALSPLLSNGKQMVAIALRDEILGCGRARRDRMTGLVIAF
jgi:hypothetical protein